MKTTKRWRVDATYSANSSADYTLSIYIEELEELQEIIEQGPDWRELKKITITYNLAPAAERLPK